MKTKKILAALLVMIMVVGILPMAVFAADTAVAEVNGVQYDTLQAAIDAANAGDTVKLIANVTLENNTGVKIAKSMTLDLGEFTISGNNSKTAAKDKASILRIGAYTPINVTINATTGGITNASDKGTAIDFGNYPTNETEDAIKNNITINGGNYISGDQVIYATNGLCTINAGYFEGVSHNNEPVINIKDWYYGDYIIYGGSFKGFNPSNTKMVNGSNRPNGNRVDWCAPNYTSIYNEDTGIYTVVNGLQALIDLAPVGGTVAVDKNYNLAETVVINKDLTLDFGAYTLTSTADAALRVYSPAVDTTINVTVTATTGGIENTNNGFAIYAGKDLKLEDESDGNDAERTNITINGGTYVTNGTDCVRQIMGLCTINGGSYKSSFGRTVLNGARWYGAEFIINGGTFYGFNPACVSVWTGFDGKDYTNFYHQHDIIAENKTAEYADGWYTVVDGEESAATVQTKSMCFPSVDVAIQAIVDMNDVANLGVLTLVADDTLTKAELAAAKNFAFILNGKTLTLPEGYELYAVTLEDGRAAMKVKEVVATEGSDVTATETIEVGTADELLAAANDGKIIKLTADFAVDFNLTLADGSVLDLNGHTITLPKKGIEISGKSITVKNGTIDCAVTKSQYTLYIAEGTTATIEGVTLKGAIYAKNGAELTLEDNTITPWASGNASAVYAYGAEVTVLSGTFKGSTQGIFKEAFGGEITVCGGRFDRKYAVTHKVLLSTMVAEGYEVVRAVDGTYKYEVVAK